MFVGAAPFVAPEIEYRPVAAAEERISPLRLPSGEDAAPLVFLLLPRLQQGKPLTKRDANPVVASAAANEIARLLERGARGEAAIDGAPLTGADVAVLVRTREQGRRMAAELRERGVRSVEIDDGSVFHTREAEQLERLLWALADPRREARVRGALAGDLFGLDAPALLALGDDEGAWSAWARRLSDWRRALGVEGDRFGAAAAARRGGGRDAPPRLPGRRAPAHQSAPSRRAVAGGGDARAARPGRARRLAEPSPRDPGLGRRRRQAPDRERRAARQDSHRACGQGSRIPGGVLPVRMGRARAPAVLQLGGHGVSPGGGGRLPGGHRPRPGPAGGIRRVAGGVRRVGAAPLRCAHAREVPVRWSPGGR